MQKFQKGDHVKVAKDLGKGMSHFTSDCEAVVLYSYDDKYGGDNTESYGIFIKGKGEEAWYKEGHLTLIEAGRCDILQQWKDGIRTEHAMKSNLDWIFSNGEMVIDSPHSASIAALANCLSVRSLWGMMGEGYVYHSNARLVLSVAAKFLRTNDKEGWLNFCKEVTGQ